MEKVNESFIQNNKKSKNIITGFPRFTDLLFNFCGFEVAKNKNINTLCLGDYVIVGNPYEPEENTFVEVYINRVGSGRVFYCTIDYFGKDYDIVINKHQVMAIKNPKGYFKINGFNGRYDITEFSNDKIKNICQRYTTKTIKRSTKY